jgi:hypothetical protein
MWAVPMLLVRAPQAPVCVTYAGEIVCCESWVPFIDMVTSSVWMSDADNVSAGPLRT